MAFGISGTLLYYYAHNKNTRHFLASIINMRAFLATVARFLPSNTKTAIKSFLASCDEGVLKLVAQLPWLSGVYYLLNRRYTAQQKAGIAGRHAFYHRLEISNARSGFLRRHIHRLEKGLLMRPRKAIFALDYIDETVEVFAQCLQSNSLSKAESDWAVSVLSEYFSVVDEHPVIMDPSIRFDALCQQYELIKSEAIPYAAHARPSASITSNELSVLYERRRSVRYFANKPVPIELLRQAIQMAGSAPSACNRQSFKFISFNTPTDAQRIGAIAAGTAGFAQQFQSLLVLVGDLSAYPFEKDRHVIYIDGALASMQLLLALETLGLGACPINWADEPVAEANMQAELNLPSYQRVLMLIAVGYADDDGMIAYSAKRPVSELLDER